MSDTLVHRLESIAARLEQAVSSLHLFGGGSSTTSSSGNSASSAGLEAWRQLSAHELQAFMKACSYYPELKHAAEWIQTIVSVVDRLIAASLVSKKPSAAELATFLSDFTKVSEAVGKAQDSRSPFANQYQALQESLSGFMWVTVTPPDGLPREMAQGGLEAADFYLTRVLTESKKLSGADVQNRAAYAVALKALLTQQANIVRDHFATGLSWNPKGEPLTAYHGASAGTTAPAAPGAPSTASSSGASGLSAVFGELSSGNVTAGLRKVTADMKSKNMKDVPALEPKKASSSVAAKPVATDAAPKEPKLYNSKGTWFVEHYDGGSVVLDQVELKENVYILKCKNTTVSVPVKCKSIQVDGCQRTEVSFKNVVSIFEVFNSQRVSIHCEEHVPSVAVDKSNGIAVNLSRTAVATPPQLITSSISEMNLVVPGKTDEDDPIEIPLPEQYLTVFKDGKLHTEAVAHSAN